MPHYRAGDPVDANRKGCQANGGTGSQDLDALLPRAKVPGMCGQTTYVLYVPPTIHRIPSYIVCPRLGLTNSSNNEEIIASAKPKTNVASGLILSQSIPAI